MLYSTCCIRSQGQSKYLTLKFPYSTSSYFGKLMFFFFFLIFGYMVCGILVLWPGIESMPHAVQVQSFNCWTTREVPWCSSNSGGVTQTSTPGDPSPWQSYLYLFILIIGHHGSTRSYPQGFPGSSSPLSSLIMLAASLFPPNIQGQPSLRTE